MEELSFIRQSWLFCELGLPEIRELTSRGTEEIFAHGDFILNAGTRNDSVWIVAKGTVSVKKRGATGDFIPITQLNEGEIFGEMSWLDGENINVWVVAHSSPCLLFRLPFTALEEFLATRPETHIQILRKFGINLSRRLRTFLT